MERTHVRCYRRTVVGRAVLCPPLAGMRTFGLTRTARNGVRALPALGTPEQLVLPKADEGGCEGGRPWAEGWKAIPRGLCHSAQRWSEATTLGGESHIEINPEGVDLSRLGNGERNSAKPKAREGRASGRERVHLCAANGDATPLGLKLFLGRCPRVARAAQPCADGWNPVGIQFEVRLAGFSSCATTSSSPFPSEAPLEDLPLSFLN